MGILYGGGRLMALRPYEEVQAERTPVTEPLTPTGVACTELECDGEMGWLNPRQGHAQIRTLNRAYCMICGWRGWI